MKRSLVLVAAAVLLAGCGGGGGGETTPQQSAGGAPAKVTLEWWHLSTAEPLKSLWAQRAKEFEAKNPHVTIKATVLENEAYKAKLTTITQSGNAPDVFASWGGGVLKQQIDAGLVKDISADVADVLPSFTPAALSAYQLDGKTYGLPTDIGLVGFWYNKKLFEKAGITEPPATWSAFLEDVKKLKAAGVTPIALAGKEKWPGHYYWAYLAMRIAGLDALKQAAVDHDFTKPDFVAAGQQVKALADLQPFQKGFLGAAYSTPDGQSATVSNGKAAMELMGQWAPSVQADSGKGLGDDLGFFRFPAVEGGKGSIDDAFGGGGGLTVGSDAPKEAIDFVKFMTEMGNHSKAVESGGVLPVLKGEESAVKDPNLKQVATLLASASGYQLYLDQAYPPAVGQQVNDSVAELIAGTKTPEEVGADITEVAKSEAG
ncbi:extracellular solute-binding protein [Nonomuraea gerenzanensis]|uniref:Maltose/maltodextrin ABC transporter, substrate binding periplasmic protein MalE n=1 Tax=Nonomuraea gerenzanensis TaxID=93944 RepID=A0A1M4E1N3_9ACTN|nr:extracellular solute-binding protein [Nonomuraea gerenzanensis]UBU15008.1 extracellular solute-binding protein [Nonomuraea gerenzanensis]SBO92750.1 Maltose/maltodextrin ABC transporter, substrate binding periplasmic protein MalE [Nonomuraea gerenzanensis]